MEEIEVNLQVGYKTAYAPNELYSGGHGPCIVVGAIYGEKGYMVHEPPLCVPVFLEPFFLDLKKDVKDLRKLQIYVAGAEIAIDDDIEMEESMLAERRRVLEKIAKNGFEEAIERVEWCKPDYCQTLRLILSERRAEFENEYVDPTLDDYCGDE